MIDQVTVFLENKEGRLRALTHTLGEAGVNMQALTIAETSDYGLVRIVCDKPAEALEALRAADFRAVVTQVLAVVVPNRPGGLSELLDVLDATGLNIEYGYCFSAEADRAVDVLKVADADRAAQALTEAGFELVA